MSSRITMILAVQFLIGAVLAGYWGLVLSRSTDTPVAAAPPVADVPAPLDSDAATVRQAVLVIASGDRRVDEARLTAIVGSVGRADAAFVKSRTGFAIGGVSPVGHRADDGHHGRHRRAGRERHGHRAGRDLRAVRAAGGCLPARRRFPDRQRASTGGPCRADRFRGP